MKSFFKALLRYGKLFAKKFTAVQTAIILGIIYFLGVGIMAILLKLLQKDLLNKKLSNSPTFWIDKEKDEVTLERARQQF
jgi:hypothetical protein